jgi:amidohydrolase
MSSLPGRDRIDEAAGEIDGQLIELRRDIHRYPELAGNERRTSALVAGQLRAAGLAVSAGAGGHGVMAVLEGAQAGPAVAYRAEMDAVEGEELSGADFASQVPGAAHLCGHDLHTAIGVGVARVLAAVRGQLPGRVVLYFQPAEETLSGAQAMISAGVLEQTSPQEIYALHCAPLPAGSFAIMPGTGLPGHDAFTIDLSGPAASAEASRLSAAVSALATVRYPQTPQDFAALLAALQAADGPLARFIYTRSWITPGDHPGQARVHGRIKTGADDLYVSVREQISQLARQASGPQAAANVTFRDAVFPAMRCSPGLSIAAGDYLRSVFGHAAVAEIRSWFPFNSEDFALFLNRVPGAMFFLGAGDPANPADPYNAIPHAPNFTADEQAIGTGTRAMAGWLASRLSTLIRSPSAPAH